MIGLLAPLGLAALAAMLVPLVIHLLRRPEDRVLPFAAWRYLLERRARANACVCATGCCWCCGCC